MVDRWLHRLTLRAGMSTVMMEATWTWRKEDFFAYTNIKSRCDHDVISHQRSTLFHLRFPSSSRGRKDRHRHWAQLSLLSPFLHLFLLLYFPFLYLLFNLFHKHFNIACPNLAKVL